MPPPDDTLPSPADLAQLRRRTILDQAESLWPQRGRKAGPVLALLAVVAAVWVILQYTRRSAPAYHWSFGIVVSYLPALANGLRVTMIITVLSIALGLLLGVFVSAGRLSRNALVRIPVTGYIEIMRGTPVLVQLIWVFYALPIVTGVRLSGVQSAVLAFTLNLGAFYGEAFRAGIQSVPAEQVETAEILGLSYWQRMQFVVLPQAFRNVLPVLLSIGINLFKDTSLVSFLGVSDLMFVGESAATNTFRPLEILTTVAVIYFLVAFPTTIIARQLELRLSRHRRSSW